MFTGQDRGQTREVFFCAWRAHRQGRPLEDVEKLIVQVALRHPEYHPILEQSEPTRERDYFPESGETNPFMHLVMDSTGLLETFASAPGLNFDPKPASTMESRVASEYP